MRRPPLYSRNFALACAATLLFFTSLMMQIPVFPDLLRARARASDAVIGIFIGLFNITGVLFRPLLGRAVARRPRRIFMATGALITIPAAVGYWAAGSLAWLIPIRLFHGTAIACFYTSSSTLVADLAPQERRGEALSFFSMFLYLGLAIGPALGLALEAAGGFGLVFGTSAAIALVCALIAREVRESPPPPGPVNPQPLISREALFPGAVLALAAVGYAAAIGFTADMAKAAGVSGRGLYFPVLAGTVILTRFFSGRASDRYGRMTIAAPGLILVGAAMVLESGAGSISPLLASAVVFGLGFGCFFPSMMAFTIDRVSTAARASAMGTFTAAFDLGFGVGSPVIGAVKGARGYPAMYRVAAGSVAAGLLVLLVGRVRAGARPATARSSAGAASESS